MDFDRVANTPVDVLAIPVPDPRLPNVTHMRTLKAAALPMKRANEWMAEANAIDAHLQAQDAGVLEDLVEFVCGYDPGWPADAIREHAAGPQIVNAFYLLKELNDPFAVAKSRAAAEQERTLRMFEALGGAGSRSLDTLIEKHLKAASADSEKSSGSTPGES